MLRLPIYPITLSTYILVTDSWNKTFGMLWNLFSSENFITSQLHHFFEYRTLVGLIKISGENGGQKRKSLARNGRDAASLMSFIIKGYNLPNIGKIHDVCVIWSGRYEF